MYRIYPRLLTALFPLLLIGMSSIVQAQDTGKSGEEVLTNQQVVAMTKARLSPVIIIGKIRTSKTNFNLATEELMRLKSENVPDEVVAAMMEASNSKATTVSRMGAGDVANADPNDPSASHDAGIYLYEERDGKKQMIQLEPSISKQTKTGGFFASAVTYGIAKIKFKAALAGQNAKLQVNAARPVFYFYFEVKNSGLSNSSYYATSPNEFVLVKLNTKENSRDVTVSQANAFGAQSGAMDKAVRPFDYQKIAPGVYKVTPTVDLDDGEYGFYNAAGAGPSGGAKIFDFGIKLPR
jgi:hypothetical protein